MTTFLEMLVSKLTNGTMLVALQVSDVIETKGDPGGI